MIPIIPPALKRGSTVALVATARAVSVEEMRPAVEALEGWGFNVFVPEGLYARNGQLAGTDEHRAALLQGVVDDPHVDAILCCRGGYGTVRIIDHVDFTSLRNRPKWIVGYSDVTVLHSHLHATMGLSTMHAVMPINFPADGESTLATESLHRLLLGEKQVYTWKSCSRVKPFSMSDVIVVGGNLSILYSLLGSCSQIDTRGKVLLIEDLDEYIYHVDRMMQALSRAGMLDGLAALMVGGLTDMHDNSTPFGCSALEVVQRAVENRGYPLITGAPFGHLGSQNLALPLGKPIDIVCDSGGGVTLYV